MELTKAFYSPHEVAELAGVHSSTILNYIASGRLYAVKLSDRTYRIPARAVLQLLAPDAVTPPTVTIETDDASTVPRIERSRKRISSPRDAAVAARVRAAADPAGDTSRSSGEHNGRVERRHRAIRAVAMAPGIAGLPEVARFAYEEWFRRLGDGSLLRVRYNYNYFDLAAGGSRGYHLHEIRPGAGPVPHAKCVASNGTGDPDAHYVAYEVDLWAAHDEFERQYAAGQPIDCRGLTLLRSRAPPRQMHKGRWPCAAVAASRGRRTAAAATRPRWPAPGRATSPRSAD